MFWFCLSNAILNPKSGQTFVVEEGAMGLRRAAHVAWRRVGEETVLIHLRDKKIYVLNPSGGFFWHGLDGSRETKQFLSSLSSSDRLAEDTPERIEAFFRDLQKADLVEIESGARTPAPDALPDFPLPAFVPPELVWQQELRNFGASCAFVAGSSDPCNAVPTT
jgi:hypothetical protein